MITFKTERLLVRPRMMADLEDCLQMDRDPDVTRYIPGPWADPAAHRAFVIDRMSQTYPDGLGYWSVIAKDLPQLFLGWVMLLPVEDNVGGVEMGWRFNRASWGHGYATEASQAVLDYAFAVLDLQKIVAEIAPGNTGSIRVAEKLGMAFVREHEIDGVTDRIYVTERMLDAKTGVVI